LITRAIEKYSIDKLYIGIGSANISGTIKNPMTVFERESYIKQFFIHKGDIFNLEKLSFEYIDDSYNEERWLYYIDKKIKDYKIDYLFYHAKKDGSSSWVENVYCKNVIDIEPITDISATQIRQSIIDNPLVENYFYDFNPYREYVKFINDYNSKFTHPYCNKTTHVTVDLLIRTIDNNHNNAIVLIKRNKGLGSGKYALIGGFVEPHETCLDAVIRECYEETGIIIPKQLIDDESKVFDAPNRSDRGRIITHVYQCYLEYYKLLDIINNFKPNDEVSEIKIVSEGEFNSNIKYNSFEDHSLLVDYCMNW
jgi:bifunctional NMN adenylyltransferase/nudix hydrolase